MQGKIPPPPLSKVGTSTLEGFMPTDNLSASVFIHLKKYFQGLLQVFIMQLFKSLLLKSSYLQKTKREFTEGHYCYFHTRSERKSNPVIGKDHRVLCIYCFIYFSYMY